MLVNNAGIVSGKNYLEVSDFMIHKTFEVNSMSILYTAREFVPDMIKNNKGHIVNISSLSSYSSPPGLSEYGGSKAAATIIDETLRLEFKKIGANIQTTCICPFFINTGMFDGAGLSWPF